MQTTQFSGILEQLTKSQSKSAGLIKTLLETKILTEPPEDHIKAHFLSKHYFYSDNILDEGDLSDHELEEMFFELTDRALFASYQGKVQLVEQYFATAKIITEELNDGFLKAQLTTLQEIAKDKDKLKKKLICDSGYEQINKMFAKSADKAKKNIGLTRSFASEIKDTKRELDVSIKTLYLLYSSDEEILWPIGIALSREIRKNAKAAGYETNLIWALFHEGNINISLGNKQRKADQPDADKARGYFLEAKNCFEAALELSIKKGFDYATMTMQERLGLVNNRLGMFNIACSNYNESLNIGEFGEIKRDWVVLKNKVRCLIGLGISDFDSACKGQQDKEKGLCKAEIYFKEARELACQINYHYNERDALIQLSDIYRERGEADEMNCILQLANKISIDYA